MAFIIFTVRILGWEVFFCIFLFLFQLMEKPHIFCFHSLFLFLLVPFKIITGNFKKSLGTGGLDEVTWVRCVCTKPENPAQPVVRRAQGYLVGSSFLDMNLRKERKTGMCVKEEDEDL